MKTSESIKNLATALLKAQGEFSGVVKDKTNPHFKSKYADLQAAIEATEAPLRSNGLLVIQTPKGCVATQSATVATRLLHISGEWIEDELELPAGTQNRCDAQTFGSAITYARRYSYLGILGIAPEDDDGNVASGHVGPQVVTRHVYVTPKTEPATFPASDAAEVEPLFDENGDLIESKATVQHREQKQARKANKPTAEERKKNGWISEGQERRFWFYVKQSNLEAADVNQYCADQGITDISQLPWKKYSDAVVWAGGPAEVRA